MSMNVFPNSEIASQNKRRWLNDEQGVQMPARLAISVASIGVTHCATVPESA